MSATAESRIKSHIDAGGIALTVVAGNGFHGLSDKTRCTYLHDRAGLVSCTIVETHPSDDLEEAADFICQQIVLGQSPTVRMQEMGIRGIKNSHISVVTYFCGLSEVSHAYIQQRILSLSKRSLDMGHISEWSDAAVESMTK